MKVKDASGAVSAPAAADLYYFPSAVYDGSLCLEARSLDDDPELFSVWELSWESPDEDNRIVSADLYLSRDGGSFRLERTVTDGSLVMGFDDAQEILMCRIAAEYEDGTYGLSDILALEKTEKEARIEAVRAQLMELSGGIPVLGGASFTAAQVEGMALADSVAGVLEEEDGGEDTDYLYRTVTPDSDDDGLGDGYEIWDLGSLPDEADSDGDGLPDIYEVETLGTSPAVRNPSGADSDGDGLTDLEEKEQGTDPRMADSDLDGIPDSTDPYPMRTDEGSGLAPALPADASAGLYDITDTGTVYNPYTGRVKKDTSASGAVSLYAYDKDGNMSACLTRADGKAYLATAS
ncbi:MAG: hypothetical protein II627_05275, partial [Lachnospiraceae bacterium]|nr:hypothetical protein [Lachnospiraceae bacterium]